MPRRATYTLILLLFYLAMVLLPCFAAPQCMMLIDKSRGPFTQTGTASKFDTFMTMINNYGVVYQDNLISPLTTISYDGVGILWIDAAFSNSSYSQDEAIAVYHFVRVRYIKDSHYRLIFSHISPSPCK